MRSDTSVMANRSDRHEARPFRALALEALWSDWPFVRGYPSWLGAATPRQQKPNIRPHPILRGAARRIIAHREESIYEQWGRTKEPSEVFGDGAERERYADQD